MTQIIRALGTTRTKLPQLQLIDEHHGEFHRDADGQTRPHPKPQSPVRSSSPVIR